MNRWQRWRLNCLEHPWQRSQTSSQVTASIQKQRSLTLLSPCPHVRISHQILVKPTSILLWTWRPISGSTWWALAVAVEAAHPRLPPSSSNGSCHRVHSGRASLQCPPHDVVVLPSREGEREGRLCAAPSQTQARRSSGRRKELGARVDGGTCPPGGEIPRRDLLPCVSAQVLLKRCAPPAHPGTHESPRAGRDAQCRPRPPKIRPNCVEVDAASAAWCAVVTGRNTLDFDTHPIFDHMRTELLISTGKHTRNAQRKKHNTFQ